MISDLHDFHDHPPLPIEDHSGDHLQEVYGRFAGQPPPEEAAETSMDITTTSMHDVGNSSRVKADFWRGLTLNPFVINSILGYRIAFIERPPRCQRAVHYLAQERI